MRDIDKFAKIFKELGHPVRLKIIKELIKYGSQGISVGELQKVLIIPSSTLTHHLSALISVSLIIQKREGRMLLCILKLNQLEQVIAFLTKECCTHQIKN